MNTIPLNTTYAISSFKTSAKGLGNDVCSYYSRTYTQGVVQLPLEAHTKPVKTINVII